MRRHDVTTVRHRLPTTLAVSSSGPYPRLKKKTLCGPWAIKKTNGLWWVGVCFWRPPWPRVRASGTLPTLFRVSEVAQSQVNDGRSFLCVCGVFFLWSIFVMSLWSPHTERNALASLGRCPPSRSIEAPFSSAALCRTRHRAQERAHATERNARQCGREVGSGTDPPHDGVVVSAGADDRLITVQTGALRKCNLQRQCLRRGKWGRRST